VLFPADQRAQRLAAYDLLGQRVDGDDRGEAAGALGRLLDLVDAYDGPTVVVSEEELSFHWRHDLLRVVDTWASVLLPDGWPGDHPVVRNVSLGCAELEVVRRLNEAVGGSLNTAQHRFVIEAGIRARLAGATVRPLRLPADGHRTGPQRGDRRRAAGGDARRARVPRPRPRPALPPLPPGLTEKEGRLPGAAEVLGSQVRAGGFLLRKRAVHHADRNPLVARAARIYLDRTSPSARLAEG
jgi:hypothetical protein